MNNGTCRIFLVRLIGRPDDWRSDNWSSTVHTTNFISGSKVSLVGLGGLPLYEVVGETLVQ